MPRQREPTSCQCPKNGPDPLTSNPPPPAAFSLPDIERPLNSPFENTDLLERLNSAAPSHGRGPRFDPLCAHHGKLRKAGLFEILIARAFGSYGKSRKSQPATSCGDP